MLARIQQFLNLSALLLTALWLNHWWARSPQVALLGALCFWLSYVGFIALEFVLVGQINQADPARRASLAQVVRAWWGEIWLAPGIFCWRQPFRPNAVPDFLPHNTQRGVVFLHGFVCNRGLWTPWMRLLQARGHAFVAVNLEPVFGSIDNYAPTVEAAVARVTQATGLPPVVVCHSMGGLAARAWLRSGANAARVHKVVTIGSPHHGTWIGQFSSVTNGRQMMVNSRWLQALAQTESAQSNARFICWYSNCDNIVFPATSATLPGADNRHVTGTAHMSLAFVPQVVDDTLSLLA